MSASLIEKGQPMYTACDQLTPTMVRQEMVETWGRQGIVTYYKQRQFIVLVDDKEDQGHRAIQLQFSAEEITNHEHGLTENGKL